MSEEKPKSATLYFIAGFFCAALIAVVLLRPDYASAPEAARRYTCAGNLNQIETAMLCYHDQYGQFPPAYTVDAAGKPLHSWRTLLLPFIEEGDNPYTNLYKEIRLDEPWDSPHNMAVYKDTSINTYKCPSNPAENPILTSYVMVTGPNCISDGPNVCGFKDLTKPLCRTAHIVETNVPIRWYEPKDLKADEINFKINDPTSPGIGSGHPGIVQIAFCNGFVKAITQSTSPDELRAMFEIKANKETKPKTEKIAPETQ